MVKYLLVGTALTLAVLAACSDSSKPAAPAYPPGPYEIAVRKVVPQGMTFDGLDGPINLDSLYEPNAAKPHLAILRESATWCGTCQWHAAHTKRLLEDPRFAGRLAIVDLLVADRDNVAPDKAALADWKSKIDSPQSVALDPHYSFSPALTARLPLPEYVFIDTRTMTILRTASDPGPVTLAALTALALAEIDGTPKPSMPEEPLTDGFSEEQTDMIRGMKIDASFAPPPDPTNAVADNPAAAKFGKALFSDSSLSPNGKVSCATCHDQSLDFTDGHGQSTGVALGDRNSPSAALASHSRWQFWDGRADTLWAQALGPFEDAKEFGGDRLFVAHRVAEAYATQYQALFGDDLATIKPLPANIAALSPEDKDKVTRVFVNVGKSIAAFERTLRVKPNALDEYAGGDLDALSQPQKDSLRAFMTNGCVQCHWGPRLTDDAFHNIRFPTGRQDHAADRGRADGLTRLSASEFRADSKWSDAPDQAKPFVVSEAALGAFKTPTLRGVATTKPFGHGGTFSSLAEVTAHYSVRGLVPQDPRSAGLTEDWVPLFDHVASDAMPAFLEVLTAEIANP